MRWSNVLGCGVTWGEVTWLVARWCHVMWCDLVSCHLMWCDFFCCVMSRDAMWCRVMCSHVMNIICCEVMRRNGMRSHACVCDEMWLVAMSRCVVRSGCVMWWIGKRAGDTYCKVLQVVHSTTTQYYKVRLQYYKVLLRTTKHYFLYYKVLLQYYSVLQSTTPVLQRTTPVLLTLYYKVLLRCYKVLLRTTKYYLQYYSVLQVLLQYYYLHCAELPRKMTLLMIDVRHIWNVIYNKRSNRTHPPTSPNTAPAAQKNIPKSKRNSPKAVEASFIWSDHESDHDPSMNWSSRTHPFAEVTFRASETHFVLKIITFRASTIYPNLTDYCACHDANGKWHCNITKCCACHEKWHCNISNIVRATKSDTVLRLSPVPRIAPATKSDTEQLLDWAVTSLSCYFTETHWTVTLLSCYFTELLLYGAVTLLSCYFTELLLYWTVTLRSFYFTWLFVFLNLRNSEVSQLNFLW